MLRRLLWRCARVLNSLLTPFFRFGLSEPGRSRAPSYAESRRATLPSSRYRDHGSVILSDGSAVKGGDGRGLKAFDDQIDAQRKLPDRDRDCEQPCRRGML